MKKLWGGRFKGGTHRLADAYNASISFDHRLAEYDIAGSLAHVRMLKRCGILEKDAADRIIQALQRLRQKIRKGEGVFRVEDEDIHMNIERMLHREIGEAAGQLHTGRSRNDQVALDLHLYVRDQIVCTVEKLYRLNEAVLELSRNHVDVILPGYTHLQRAEPVRFAHHMLAYFHMLDRDARRFMDSFARVNVSPLGAGALAGSGVRADREYAAGLLHFDAVYENSLDAVSDRDFVVEFLSNAALTMMHLSRLSEEIVLWSSREFSFVELDEAFCTGSSMMPQKRNPDVAELARGKTGRVYGALMAMLTVLKGLPLAYNKDLQEDKEGLFDTVDTLHRSLDVYAPMLASMRINTHAMAQAAAHDYSNATQLANYLVNKGMTFREAHALAGGIVRYGIDNGQLLKDIPLAGYREFHPDIDEDVYRRIDLESVVEAHETTGGTARAPVLFQIEQAGAKMAHLRTWLDRMVPL